MDAYDYIIIGAGSAGCVLANRLSANPANRVLLLEAGMHDNHFVIKTPGLIGFIYHSKRDWGLYSAPQTQLNGRKLYLPRGKTLGGSSSTNVMLYVRGNKKDYDTWEALGNKGWSYKDVLPYFKKSEHYEVADSQFHGKNGPLHVTRGEPYRIESFSQRFLDACQAVGIEINPDINGAEQAGASIFDNTIKDGLRHSTSAAFLKPVISRENLRVKTQAFVQRILIKDNKAIGVEYKDKKGNLHTVNAEKEVILSAGAFQSPQILMLSGIGAEDELTQHDIRVKHHLPGVGKNLQDHLMVPVGMASTIQSGFNHYQFPHHSIKSFIKYYMLNRKGNLRLTPITATAFLCLENKKKVDFQIHFASVNFGKKQLGVVYTPTRTPWRDGATLLPTLLNPKSRGFVSLQSANATDPPLIQPNFLSDPDDLAMLIKGVKKSIEIIKTKPFSSITKKSFYPEKATDQELAAYIKQNVETIYHPVGTCKMGSDPMAVVNDKLQVHGIDNLRVVDASIMPLVTTGNTNAPTIMIAEKAADFILGK